MEQHGAVIVCSSCEIRVPCNVSFAPQTCIGKYGRYYRKIQRFLHDSGIIYPNTYLSNMHVILSYIYIKSQRTSWCSNYFINDSGSENYYRIVTCAFALQSIQTLKCVRLQKFVCEMWHCKYITSSILDRSFHFRIPSIIIF